MDDQLQKPSILRLRAEFGRTNTESEIQHLAIRDHAVCYEDIKNIAEKISCSLPKKFSIEFCDCDLKAEHLRYLHDEIQVAHCQKITAFKISHMKNINDLLEETCSIVRRCKIARLSLEYDHLDDESVELFQGYLKDKKVENLKNLDISYNYNISELGIQKLGEILKNSNNASLKATDCDITDEKLKKFLLAMHGKKMKELDIGANNKLTNEGFKTLAEFVANSGVDRLKLGGCRLSKENIGVFNEFPTKTRQESLLEELDVSYNSTIEPESSLGSVVFRCGVTKLCIAGCKLSADHLVCLRESMKNHTLDLINMRDNVSIGQGIAQIAEIVKQCKVKELNISDCMFSGHELERFRKTLKDEKISRLHLGDREREPDEKYIDELCALLKNVEDVLYLRFYKLNDAFRTSLKNNCRKINLTVGGKKEELCENKRGGSEPGVRSVNEESSSSTQMETSPPQSLEKKDFEDSLKEPSPTSLATEKRKWQELGRSMIVSTKKIRLVEPTMKQLENTQDRLEDVFREEILRAFVKMDDFMMFVRSENGLCLDEFDIQPIIENNPDSVINQKMALLNKWREIKGEEATARKIRDLATGYKRGDNPDDYISLRKNMFGIFKKELLSKHGHVFLGEQLSDLVERRLRAIKLVPYDDENLREAQILTKLGTHENIISTIHADSLYAGPIKFIFIVMELFFKTNLRDVFGKWNLDKRKAIDFAIKIIKPLVFIHEHNILHRDLKPENILVSDDLKQLKLSGFGIKKAIFDGYKTIQTDGFTGTEGYRAQETYDQKISAKADVFSAGVTLAEIFSNGKKHPYGDNPHLLNSNIINRKKPDLSQVFVVKKPQPQKLLSWMLQPEPEDRPTAEEVQNDLEQLKMTQVVNKLSAGDKRPSTSSLKLTAKKPKVVVGK